MGWPTDEAVDRGAGWILDQLGVDDRPADDVARGVLDAAGFPELVGYNDAAKILGVVATSLDKVSGLPKPVARIGGGRVWLADEIRALAAERARRKATA